MKMKSTWLMGAVPTRMMAVLARDVLGYDSQKIPKTQGRFIRH